MPLSDSRRTLSDFVFGYDYFVCHSWKDAHTYAEAVVRGLEPHLRCFIDSRDFQKSASWTIQGGRALLSGLAGAIETGPSSFEASVEDF